MSHGKGDFYSVSGGSFQAEGAKGAKALAQESIEFRDLSGGPYLRLETPGVEDEVSEG